MKEKFCVNYCGNHASENSLYCKECLEETVCEECGDLIHPSRSLCRSCEKEMHEFEMIEKKIEDRRESKHGWR